jgi:hypothetical protein
MGFIIVLAGRSDDRGINERSRLDPDRPRFELGRDRVEQDLVQFTRHQRRAEPDECRPLGRRLLAGKPAKPPERCPIIQGFCQLHVR